MTNQYPEEQFIFTATGDGIESVTLEIIGATGSVVIKTSSEEEIAVRFDSGECTVARPFEPSIRICGMCEKPYSREAKQCPHCVDEPERG